MSTGGQTIGYVTSAAVDVDGIILGLAHVQSRYAKPGDEIGIFNVPGKPMIEESNKADLTPGDKVALPYAATLLPRSRTRPSERIGARRLPANERLKDEGRKNDRQSSAIRHSSFVIRHSSFVVGRQQHLKETSA